MGKLEPTVVQLHSYLVSGPRRQRMCFIPELILFCTTTHGGKKLCGQATGGDHKGRVYTRPLGDGENDFKGLPWYFLALACYPLQVFIKQH